MRTLLAVVSAVVLLGCSTGKKPDDDAFQAILDQNSTIDSELISSVLQQIPSPLEISVLLKESGKGYDATFLNSPDNAGKYNTNHKMALNLGVYGTDLGYTNVYQKSQDGSRYLKTIKSLADGLNIGQFFDIETIGRLASNSKNMDSLLLLTTQNFNSINDYLQSQNRTNLSVLLLTGGWVEALQITCEMSSKVPKNKTLSDTIGEQKIILEQIMLLLSLHGDDEVMASLLADMQELKRVYERVVIHYQYQESTVEVIDGVAVVKDNSVFAVDITPEDVIAIKDVTTSIRNKIIS
jgi:hypothetical protein